MVNYKYKCVACAFTGTVPTWELNRNFPKTKTFERYHKGEKIETKYIKMYNFHIQRYLKTAFFLRNVGSHVQLSFAWRYNSCFRAAGTTTSNNNLLAIIMLKSKPDN